MDGQKTEFKTYQNRETRLGNLPIYRALPTRGMRMVGPWCFLDRFGPLTFSSGKPMDVPPHPHIGLQTVTWLLEGEVLHSDSLGYQAVVKPGGVNIMTAGYGIAHAEETPADNCGRLNGVQLWVALPENERSRDPSFTSLSGVPVIELEGGILQVIAGSYQHQFSPALYFSEIIGLDVCVYEDGNATLELDPQFEHALLLLEGDCQVENTPLQEGVLYSMGLWRTKLDLYSQAGGRVLIIGGPPFPEKIVMWWNFVARNSDEISQARADWEEGLRFGDVAGKEGLRLPAPDLLRYVPANPAS